MKIGYRTPGVSLVEVMVTMILLSMAAAGMVSASVHIRSSASQSDAAQAAGRLASEFSEWLRLRGDQPLRELPEDPVAWLTAAGMSRECYSAACRPAESALFFLRDWTRRLRAQVPGAVLMLCHGQPAGQATTEATTDSTTKATTKAGLSTCAEVVRDEHIVWFRLTWPRTPSRQALVSTIAFSVRRTP